MTTPQTGSDGLSPFVEALAAFDSHERGILFQWAADTPFPLAPARMDELSRKIGVQVPARPYLAMDYTLDWLHAALTCFLDPRAWEHPQPIVANTVTGSQEDVDLLVAWEDQAGPHLLLVEAKGFTGWSNKQMSSKAARLGAICTPAVLDKIDVHFVLVGPSESKGLNHEAWPEWMRKHNRLHFLPIPDPGVRWGVRRSNPTLGPGDSAKSWSHWSAVKRKWH